MPRHIPQDIRFEWFTCYTGDCIVWTGAINRDGYGFFTYIRTNGANGWAAHQYAYERAYGAIPPGLVINHLCRNRACVNSAHLEAITNTANAMHPLSESIGRINADKKFCVNGHAFTPESTRVLPTGYRACIPCELLKTTQHRALTRAMANIPEGYEGKWTIRQQQILDLIGKGKSTKEIAQALDLSIKGVEFHKTAIKKTLQAQQVSA